MKELIIEKTPDTPHIELNHLTGDLIFYGKSLPENSERIYEPVLQWVSEYIMEARPVTNLRLNLECCNTSSTVWFTKIFKMLLRLNEPDFTVILHLYLPIEDYEEINDFEDIKDAFLPLSNIDNNYIPCIEIKLYGLNGKGEICKETLIFIEDEQFAG